MRALVIGHDHVAGIEHLEQELVARGYGLSWLQVVPEHRFSEPDVAVDFPAATGWDLVVTLGAPWPRERIAGWAHDEVEFLTAVRGHGAATLGICFGAQLLAESLGAPAVALPAPRIGWHPVTSRAREVEDGPWFQWHADQLAAPEGSEVLAESVDGVEVFRLGRCVGVQFHPEMTPRLLERWLGLPGGPPAELDLPQLRTDTTRHTPDATRATRKLIDLVASPVDRQRLLHSAVVGRPEAASQGV